MKNKIILIIGGTGALGKTLIKKYYDTNELIVFSRDEHKHYHLLKEYYPEGHLNEGRVKMTKMPKGSKLIKSRCECKSQKKAQKKPKNKTVKKIDTDFLFKNQKAIMFGLPGAFTAVCSAKHLPGFIKNYE